MEFCGKCGKELTNGKCKNCKKGKIFRIIGISIAVIVVVGSICSYLYSKKYTKQLEEYFSYEYKIEEVTPKYLKLMNYNIDQISDVSYISLKDIKKSNVISHPLNSKCSGYVTIDLKKKRKAYIKCGSYTTYGYNKKYEKTKIYIDNNPAAIKELTRDTSKVYVEIDEEVKELNYIFNETEAKIRFFYLLGPCVGTEEDEWCHEENRSINKDKVYFSDMVDRIRYAMMYIVDDDSLQKNYNDNRSFKISTFKFNEYLKKLFGVELSDSEISNTYKDILGYNERNDDGFNVNEVTIFDYDGLGEVHYVMVVSKKPTVSGDTYTTTVDLLKVNDGWDKYTVGEYYNASDVQGSMTLKYKKLEDGTRQIISLQYNK